MHNDKKLLFLTSPEQTPSAGFSVNDNDARLAEAFRRASWAVFRESHDSLCWDDGKLLAGSYDLSGFDLVWPVGFGPRQSFYDRMQLLSLLPCQQLITAPQAFLLLHGKASWLEHCSATHIACDAALFC